MSEKKTKLFRIRKTVCKMLNARGYLVAQAELDRDKDSFTEEFGEDPRRDALTLQFDLREDPTQHIFVFFPDEEKVGVKTIKEYAKRMKAAKIGVVELQPGRDGRASSPSPASSRDGNNHLIGTSRSVTSATLVKTFSRYLVSSFQKIILVSKGGKPGFIPGSSDTRMISF